MKPPVAATPNSLLGRNQCGGRTSALDSLSHPKGQCVFFPVSNFRIQPRVRVARNVT
jgi:hypothetical protein